MFTGRSMLESLLCHTTATKTATHPYTPLWGMSAKEERDNIYDVHSAWMAI